jgi:ABC-type transporter Mla MlaB component
MPDLILSITPEHDVRCFLAPDEPDPLRGGFRIFDFLPVIARPPNEYRKDGGGFANNYWKSLKDENSPAFFTFNDTLVWNAPIKALTRNQHTISKVTTAEGLLRLLEIVQSRLPFDKEYPTINKTDITTEPFVPPSREKLPDPSSDDFRFLPMAQQTEIKREILRRIDEDGMLLLAHMQNEKKKKEQPRPKINAELTAVVSATLKRFIEGDRSMLREYDTDHLSRIQNKFEEDNTRNVFFQCLDRVVMGVYHPVLKELVFSVYDLIDLGRTNGTDKQRFYYTRHMWADMKKKLHPCVGLSVNAMILGNTTCPTPFWQPAVKMSNIHELFLYVVNDAKKKAISASSGKPYKGMWKNKTYDPVRKDICIELTSILKKFENGDESFIKNYESTTILNRLEVRDNYFIDNK